MYTRDLILAKFAQIFMKILYSPGFQVIACDDLDVELLDPKSNQHIYECKYTCKNWLKLNSYVWETWPLAVTLTFHL